MAPSDIMDPSRRPSRPAVASLASALAAVERWLSENRYDSVRDGDGLDWRLALEVTHIPAPGDANKVLWQVRLDLAVDVGYAELVRSGVLDAKKDARLLELVGEEMVPLRMKPRLVTAPSEEELRLMFAEAVPKLRAEIAGKSLISIKRELIGRWIDQRGRFGGTQFP